jgi:2-keto-4-pentenoate hydratase/2-oxohepta-3-ene-1,7-dioic acid hydratase in catechol pathway
MKIICIGRNYIAHAEELKNEVPTSPVVFMKPSTALLVDNADFALPTFTNNCQHEVELVLRIGKNGKNIDMNDAMQYIDAITVGIDFTARDLQDELKKKGLPWELAKGFDGSAVVGIWVDANAIKDWSDINFVLYKNRELAQQGNSSNMIFSFERIISFVSEYFALEAGDIIYTGTPQGVDTVGVGDVLEGFLEDDSMFEMNVVEENEGQGN